MGTIHVEVGGTTVRVTLDGNEVLLSSSEADELAGYLTEAAAQSDDPTFEPVGEVYGN